MNEIELLQEILNKVSGMYVFTCLTWIEFGTILVLVIIIFSRLTKRLNKKGVQK